MSFLHITGFCAFFGMVVVQSQADVSNPEWKLPALEQRLKDIEKELKQLPALAMRSDAGAIGYRSDSHDHPHNTEWIQIDLGDDQSIDEIILVPTIRRDTQDSYQADAFPISFHIIAGSKGDPEGTQIANYTASDNLLPRTAPLMVPCPGLQASWIRIVATELNTRAWDDLYVFQLAEVMLFKDGINLALGKSISASSSSPGPEFTFAAHKKRYIVDGFLPYIMDGYKGAQSIPYACFFPHSEKPVFIIDLEESLPINQINIHGIELTDSIPQSNSDDYGMPRHLHIQGANQADFSDARALVDYQINSIYDSGSISLHQFPEGRYRYLKFTVIELDITRKTSEELFGILGLAEIEVFSGGTNVALGKAVIVKTKAIIGRENPEALTDGRNYYGEILPFDSWMRQLARRHELERERPKVLEAINLGYARQKTNLRFMVYLATALAVGIIIIYLLGRMRGMRQIALIRKRFAADLHDELGANLHAIGLLSDLASHAVDKKEQLKRIVGEVRTVTERTSDAIRYCANSQEARDPMGSLGEDMERIAKRMMHEMHYKITVKGDLYLKKLKLFTRHDLFLFYKECLVNISRHSEATEFSVQLTADSKQINLTIEDNGLGYTPRPNAEAPPSLKRRAQLMHADLQLQSPKNGGTRVILILKRRRYLFITK